MRPDLQYAARRLGILQQILSGRQLQQIEALLGSTEAVEAIGAGTWRGRRAMVVVTSSRLLLVRRPSAQRPPARCVVPLPRTSQVEVIPLFPAGARLQMLCGDRLEEFFVLCNESAVVDALHRTGP